MSRQGSTMNCKRLFPGITLVLAGFLAVAFPNGSVLAEESGSQRCIVILKSRTGPVPDLARLGGTVIFRQEEQVNVTLPPSALPALRSDPLVRYVQIIAGDGGSASLSSASRKSRHRRSNGWFRTRRPAV